MSDRGKMVSMGQLVGGVTQARWWESGGNVVIMLVHGEYAVYVEILGPGLDFI